MYIYVYIYICIYKYIHIYIRASVHEAHKVAGRHVGVALHHEHLLVLTPATLKEINTER